MGTKHAVLTGDIVNSRGLHASLWLPVLEQAIRQYSTNFDIYRGDSFQVELAPQQSIWAMFYIRTCMRTIDQLDVRMGLGIGEVSFTEASVKLSNGEAYLNSGIAFDGLGKELMQVKSPWSTWDEPANIMLQLLTALGERWTINMAETVKVMIENPDFSQRELAQVLNRKYQSQVSTELGKANWLKLKKTIHYCTTELLKQW
ncbi:hypothetical protein ACL9RF_06755 [Sphingobacterium sp. Mn56C]|uniref:hypothetical protein n=1 Tax=Sphingobacterium sp. Mn56C TaxID=3395261 RepID=UPI003BD7DA61